MHFRTEYFYFCDLKNEAMKELSGVGKKDTVHKCYIATLWRHQSESYSTVL